MLITSSGCYLACRRQIVLRGYAAFEAVQFAGPIWDLFGSITSCLAHEAEIFFQAAHPRLLGGALVQVFWRC